MNYLETGLPHTELYKRKSEFVPPRYKPLCGLGRKYLGLEPMSKSEVDSIINRLCQPKKPPEPDDPIKILREVRPIVSGTGRFNGHKRMTGGQINRMVDRLTKRKTEKPNDDVDNKVEEATESHETNKEKEEHSEQESDDITTENSKDAKEMQNSNIRQRNNDTHGENIHMERHEGSRLSRNDVRHFVEVTNPHGKSNQPENEHSGDRHKIGEYNTHRKYISKPDIFENVSRRPKTEVVHRPWHENSRSSVSRSNRVEPYRASKTEIAPAQPQASKSEERKMSRSNRLHGHDRHTDKMAHSSRRPRIKTT